LRDARAMRDEARTLIAKGINPRIAGKQKQQAGEHTFIAVYERWLADRALALEEGRQSTLRLTDRMSENTVNFALKRMGFDGRLTGHGLRATMSTALNEIGYPKAWVDAQLSHADLAAPAGETGASVTPLRLSYSWRIDDRERQRLDPARVHQD